MSIPRQVKDSVLREFNHHCAKCGSPRPQLHHIDENPANNAAENLIPLCPNCHLSDQHDASNSVPVEKLRLFRRYKHRLILKPQFNPVFKRLQFFYTIEESHSANSLHKKGQELADLVRCLSLGQFYADQIHKLIKPPATGIAYTLGDPASEARAKELSIQHAQKYRQQLRNVAPRVEELLVEMLDYQGWEDQLERDGT